MRLNTRALLGALSALLLTGASAIANAERVYFLVGTRHVYRIGTDPYVHVTERQKIEQDYADQVAEDQGIFNKALADGEDPAVERPDFEKALDDLAIQRDEQLGAIFELADGMRLRHPELKIDGDGPYQVMGINFHMRGDFEVFENFVVVAPWPGYVIVDHPYGWTFGIVYNPFAFRHAYFGWHEHYIAIGRPAFVGFYGHLGPVRIEGIMRGPKGEWVQRAPAGRFDHGAGTSRFDDHKDHADHSHDANHTSRYHSRGKSGEDHGKKDGGH